jgi:DNA invertase Pin-like site-specific DNA recombinase
VNIALYARVSTTDGRQHLENQLQAMREFVADDPAPPSFPRAWKITGEYTDLQSGADDHRPGLADLMADARARRFDLVLVFDLSRLTRGGPAKAFEYISSLKRHGVEFWSLKEPHFRTSGPEGMGEVFIALAAHIAREERRAIRERIRAGLARARKEGKQIGRPAKRLDPGRLLRYLAEGKSQREIARLEKSTPTTVQRHLARLRKGTE